MTAVGEGVIATLPRSARWDFGGHPYGLEPLTLPLDPLEDQGGSVAVAHAPGLPAAAPGLPAPDQVEQVFWFRWITGHQATFVLWQMLARAMAEAAADPRRREAACRRAARLVGGYSAMLLYTGSCPRELYHRMIRPSMALQHPGFSGTWARDYVPVRALLRGQVPAGWGEAGAELLRECRLGQVVHQGIADKLVPGAPSLLQGSLGQGRSWRRGLLSVLYDTYFLTLRAPLPRAAVAVQLVRRLHAIRQDLAANGLYPRYAPSDHEKPPELRAAAVAARERSLPDLLAEIAADALERPAGDVIGGP